MKYIMDQPATNSHPSRSLPWWLYTLFAVFFYVLLKHLLPAFIADNQDLSGLRPVMETAAPIAAIGFLFLAANALYKNGDNSKAEDDEETPPT